MSKKNNSWPELGIITRNPQKDKDGNVLKDKAGNIIYKLGFKLADNVTVMVDGQVIELNKYRTGILKSPVEEVEGLIKNGAITEDKIESRRQTAKDAHDWLRYKIQLPPPRVEEEK